VEEDVESANKCTQSIERIAPFSSPISVETDEGFCPQRRGYIRGPRMDRRFLLRCCRNPSWGSAMQTRRVWRSTLITCFPGHAAVMTRRLSTGSRRDRTASRLTKRRGARRTMKRTLAAWETQAPAPALPTTLPRQRRKIGMPPSLKNRSRSAIYPLRR
jgi:hypothetical protein